MFPLNVRCSLKTKYVYSISEAAEILGIGRNTAYLAARTGEIPTIRIRNRLLVPRKAIDLMLDSAVTGRMEQKGESQPEH